MFYSLRDCLIYSFKVIVFEMEAAAVTATAIAVAIIIVLLLLDKKQLLTSVQLYYYVYFHFLQNGIAFGWRCFMLNETIFILLSSHLVWYFFDGHTQMRSS